MGCKYVTPIKHITHTRLLNKRPTNLSRTTFAAIMPVTQTELLNAFFFNVSYTKPAPWVRLKALNLPLAPHSNPKLV